MGGPCSELFKRHSFRESLLLSFFLPSSSCCSPTVIYIAISHQTSVVPTRQQTSLSLHPLHSISSSYIMSSFDLGAFAGNRDPVSCGILDELIKEAAEVPSEASNADGGAGSAAQAADADDPMNGDYQEEEEEKDRDEEKSEGKSDEKESDEEEPDEEDSDKENADVGTGADNAQSATADEAETHGADSHTGKQSASDIHSSLANKSKEGDANTQPATVRAARVIELEEYTDDSEPEPEQPAVPAIANTQHASARAASAGPIVIGSDEENGSASGTHSASRASSASADHVDGEAGAENAGQATAAASAASNQAGSGPTPFGMALRARPRRTARAVESDTRTSSAAPAHNPVQGSRVSKRRGNQRAGAHGHRAAVNVAAVVAAVDGPAAAANAAAAAGPAPEAAAVAPVTAAAQPTRGARNQVKAACLQCRRGKAKVC